jgi:excisionase family DNA binding protein
MGTIKPQRRSLPELPGMQNPQRLLNKAEMSEILGLHKRGLEELMARRVIPFYRVSARCVRFDPDAVKNALERFIVREVQR